MTDEATNARSADVPLSINTTWRVTPNEKKVIPIVAKSANESRVGAGAESATTETVLPYLDLDGTKSPSQIPLRMASNSTLKRKVYPQDTSHGQSSSKAGKWAALAFAVLAGVLIWGTLQVVGYFEYDSLELAGESQLQTTLKEDDTCDLTLNVPIRNTELGMVMVTNGSLRYEGVVKKFNLNEPIRGEETRNLTIELAIARCDPRTWTADGERLWLEYERVGEGNTSSYHARLDLGDWTPDAPVRDEAPTEDDPESSVIVR